MLSSSFLILVMLTIKVYGTPIHVEDWDIVYNDGAGVETFISTNISDLSDDTKTTTTTSDKAYLDDDEISKKLGITPEFLQELKTNLEKAIEVEKVKDDRSRQGGVGDFFGVGGGGGPGGNPFGQGNQGEDEDEDEETGPTTQGPGAAGILTGLFGIFSGIGSLNPQRVIQSTVNFFPPDRRVLAQMALDSAFPMIHNTTTLAPLTDAPPRRKTTPSLMSKSNEGNSTATETPWPQILHPTTSTPAPSKTTPRKKLIFKETSLLEDFEEAVDVFQPSKPGDKDSGKTMVASSLEMDFADTADKFKIESLLSSEVEKEREKEKEKVDAIAKDFLDTVLRF